MPADLDSIVRYAQGVRRRLHRIPELLHEEHQTAALIRGELSRLGLPHVTPRSVPTAVVSWFGPEAAPCIAIRADTDALPILEETGVPHRSRFAGRMHACGHDGHSAILLGLARLLKRRQATLPARVKLIWQPAEEGGGGAARLVSAGVLDGRLGPKVSRIYGLHGWPGKPVGMIGSRVGPMMASVDNFHITIHGKGCHGAMPHLGHDPILALSHCVVSLQSLVSRSSDPTLGAVVTTGQINAGTAPNIIPDSATAIGTLRALLPAQRQSLRRQLVALVKSVAQSHGCRATVKWGVGYPPVVNPPAPVASAARAARSAGLVWRELERPCMGGEDFSHYQAKVAGAFMFLGLGVSCAPLHTSRFDFVDGAIAPALQFWESLVMQGQ